MSYQRRADADTDGTIDDIDGAAYWQRRGAALSGETDAAQVARVERRIEHFLSVWTLAVTQERRALWNATVRGGTYTRRGGKDLDSVGMERDLGFTFNDLREAIQRHGL